MGRAGFKSKRLRGGENGELLFSGYGSSAWENESVLEVDSGDGYRIM